MPEIIEETEVSLDRSDLHRRYPIRRPVTKGKVVEPARTPGIHLSGILRYLAIEGGMFKFAQADIDEELLPLRMALGLAWEEFAVSLYPEIDWQPGEMTHEGIVMTCDGLSQLYIPNIKGPFNWAEHRPDDPLAIADTMPCLEEFKLTWKKRLSAEDLIRDQWYWMQQGRGYCWGYETRYVRWHICYIMGDYRGGGPIYMRYLIRFSDEEVEKSARMLQTNVATATKKGYCE